MPTSISAITGLQNLPNLQSFDASDNYLESVDFSGLTNLTYVRLEDCDFPDSNTNSLTSVNVTGCTALEYLDINDADFSAGFPDLSSCTSLQYFDADGPTGYEGSLDLSNLPALKGFDLSSNSGITEVIISSTQPLGEYIDRYGDRRLTFNGCSLTETSVNNILIALDENGVENGEVYLDGETNSYPTGNGATSKANLISKGWIVETNLAPPGRVGIAASTDFDIVGDFTIEMFVNLTNTNGNPRPYSFGVYPAANAISFENGTMYFWGNNGIRLSGEFNPTIGEWYHICVQRSSDVLKMFIDGVPLASTTYADDIPSQELPLTIGYGNEANSGFNGLMSNFRWTNSEVYDPSGFTVPTTPLADLSQSILLIFQGNDLSAQLVDNSGNGHDATNTGATFSTNDPADSAAGSLQMGNV